MDQLLPDAILRGHKVFAPSIAPEPAAGKIVVDDQPPSTQVDSDTFFKNNTTLLGSSLSSKVIDIQCRLTMISTSLPPPLLQSAVMIVSASTPHSIIPAYCPSLTITAPHCLQLSANRYHSRVSTARHSLCSPSWVPTAHHSLCTLPLYWRHLVRSHALCDHVDVE